MVKSTKMMTSCIIFNCPNVKESSFLEIIVMYSSKGHEDIGENYQTNCVINFHKNPS